jgi:hypothetical protein
LERQGRSRTDVRSSPEVANYLSLCRCVGVINGMYFAFSTVVVDSFLLARRRLEELSRDGASLKSNDQLRTHRAWQNDDRPGRFLPYCFRVKPICVWPSQDAEPADTTRRHSGIDALDQFQRVTLHPECGDYSPGADSLCRILTKAKQWISTRQSRRWKQRVFIYTAVYGRATNSAGQ